MSRWVSQDEVFRAIERLTAEGRAALSSSEIGGAIQGSPATVRRHLERLSASGQVIRSGAARATRYALAQPVKAATDNANGSGSVIFSLEAVWSSQSQALLEKLMQRLAARHPVSYQRKFVDAYMPNETWLLPRVLAEELFSAGRMQGQLPAGTYARKVLEQLRIDLSWSSSRLEGNRYSLLATEELFKSGTSLGDTDAVMLLNHKAAIEFLVDATPTLGMSVCLVRNLHAVLMQDLLPDSEALGAISKKVVNITDTTYVPMQVPSILNEVLNSVIDKARHIKNPIEAAFFLWVNLAYLQPFEDGNKRTSRLAANIPLMLYNCAPLSFLDVDVDDYARAMLGMYEFRDVSLAADLFAWTYRRSMKKYVVVMESMGAPDPLRMRYREALKDAIGLVVRDRKPMLAVTQELDLTPTAAPGFLPLLTEELNKLEVFNCARYRLTMQATEAWIAAGRPR